MKTKRSEEIFEKARGILPGGVNSPVRSFRSVGGHPIIVSKGSGAKIVDSDGNEYIDLVCSWGALLHGHNHPRIREAILRAVEGGTSFGTTCEAEVLLGEKIKKALPYVDLVRLVNSGTEACMSAIRLARGLTGRDLILKFDGHYHGHGDSFLVGAGSGVAALHQSESAGLPQAIVENTLVVPFNNLEIVQEVFKKFDKKIAGVILEVVCGNMGTVAPDPEFLLGLRRLTEESQTVLIFDEVMTGFRQSRSGAGGLYQIDPDLICLGKIIGGGLPIGAYGGKKKFMEQIAPLGPVYQAGTMSGNPVSAAAGIASLEIIEESDPLIYQKLDHAASEWRTGLEAHIKMRGYPVSISQMGSMFTVFFRPERPRNYAEARTADLERFKKFFWSLLKQGVYYPPSQFEACFLSSAHDGAIIEKLVGASQKALDEAYAA